MVVVVWWKAEIEPCGHLILGVNEDVEGGCGVHSLPYVGMRSRDAVQVSLGFSLSHLCASSDAAYWSWCLVAC